MDTNTFVNAGITSGIITLLYTIYKLFKHSSCTSNCCGRKTDFEINLTPPRSESFMSKENKPTVIVDGNTN